MIRPIHVLAVVGARPNFVKIDPIFRRLEAEPDAFCATLVHTGQHYDDRMSAVFFDQLGIRKPDVNLEIGSGSHAQQTAHVMLGIEPVLRTQAPDVVVVVGDVNSTMASTLTAVKLGIPVAHVEAGLRSGDRSMPEEINRVVTDSIASCLLTTSRDADENLLAEGIAVEKIQFVGNVMIDTLLRCREQAMQSAPLEKLGVVAGGYALVTIHRPSNVDDPKTLAGLVEAWEEIQKHLTLVVPLHPRTAARLKEFGFEDRIRALPRIRIIEPQGYLEFLGLQAHARLVLTDSGGVQEETTVLGVPCLTLRDSTERPVTMTHGTNRLIGSDKRAILDAVQEILNGGVQSGRTPDLWDGRAADRIVDAIRRMPELSARVKV